MLVFTFSYLLHYTISYNYISCLLPKPARTKFCKYCTCVLHRYFKCTVRCFWMNILLLNLISIALLQCLDYSYSLDYSPSKEEEACLRGSAWIGWLVMICLFRPAAVISLPLDQRDKPGCGINIIGIRREQELLNFASNVYYITMCRKSQMYVPTRWISCMKYFVTISYLCTN